jgi:hypothetical protein
MPAGQERPATSSASFINQVQAFINSGTLTQSDGQALTDAANAIRSNLGC